MDACMCVRIYNSIGENDAQGCFFLSKTALQERQKLSFPSHTIIQATHESWRNTLTQTNLDIVLLRLKLGLTVVLDINHMHTETHTTSLATRHVTLVLYAQPFPVLALSLIPVFHPDRCQQLVDHAAD